MLQPSWTQNVGPDLSGIPQRTSLSSGQFSRETPRCTRNPKEPALVTTYSLMVPAPCGAPTDDEPPQGAADARRKPAVIAGRCPAPRRANCALPDPAPPYRREWAPWPRPTLPHPTRAPPHPAWAPPLEPRPHGALRSAPAEAMRELGCSCG